MQLKKYALNGKAKGPYKPLSLLSLMFIVALPVSELATHTYP